MNLNYYIKKALSIPPQELAKKVVNKLNNNVKNKLQRTKDLSKGTHIDFDVPLIQNSYIDIKQLNTSNIDIKVAEYLSQMYIGHRFDLLGSGWVENSYDSVALGVEGYKYEMNVSAPSSVLDDYELIDWQKDFKSGFRWSEKVWYKDQRIGHKIGSDIKVPWEIARLQHLPQLAIFALRDDNLRESNIREFKFEVLDFIENNPPRMGVNWVCTMDVGIRAANILVAYDLFHQLDSTKILDDEFKQIIANSMYEHGKHIVNNLEYSDRLTSNHYLSDIAGLLFISSYLENSDDIDQWLAFSVQEIINEMKKEFYEDGGNFESSTCYHRLSGELIIYSTALVMGLKKKKVDALQNYKNYGWRVQPKLKPFQNQQYITNSQLLAIEFPQWYIDRLYKIGRFTVDITKPNGDIPQFGDNDSGRFFRLSPNGVFLTNKEAVNKYFNLKGYNEDNKLFWDENILNHSTFVSCLSGLYEDKIFRNGINFEKSFIQTLARRSLLTQDKSYQNISIKRYNSDGLNYEKNVIYKLGSNFQTLNYLVYPDSGIFIFKADNFYLAVCATPHGQNDNGGHTHNDKLSYELWINGKDIARDPGTYLYTPLSNRRNEFRSLKAHNVPIVGNFEQNSWIEGVNGLFSLLKESACTLVNYSDSLLEIGLIYKGIVIVRKFEIIKNEIKITDKANYEFQYSIFNYYSNGYGKVEKL